MATFVVATALLALWVVPFGLGRQREPWETIIGTFVWLLVGMLVAGWSLYRSAALPARRWRGSYAWLYGVVLLVWAFVTVANVLAPMIADVYFKRAQAYEGAGRGQQALPAYLSALSWVTYQDYYYVFLGRLFLEQAGNAQDKPSSLRLERVSDLSNIGRLDQLGREDLAQASLVALLAARELSPRSTDNWANLARLYGTWAEISSDPAKQQERYQIASSLYQEATRLSPNLAYLHEEWGASYIAQGKTDEALATLNQAVAVDDQYPHVYVRLGDLSRMNKDMNKAIEQYSKALAIDQRLAPAYVGLGFALYQQGKLKDALDATQLAARYAPQDPSAHRNLALLYRELNRLDDAIKEAQTALRFAPVSQQPELRRLLEELQKAKGT